MQARCTDGVEYRRRIRGGSIHPAVQNIIPACRAPGLATVPTVNRPRPKVEVKALPEIPADVHS
jgi:hypothetical protein